MDKFEATRGMRDFLPEEMEKRRYVIDIIRTTFKTYGFGEIWTPALESLGLLSAKSGGGDEIAKTIFTLKDQGGRMLGLKFDQTVPTSRVIANNPQLTKPFKRFIISPVWRYERPQAGRYREFWQADVDIFGSKNPEADVETVACTAAVLTALEFEEYEIIINNRKLLKGLAMQFGFKENQVVDLQRCIDKLDKNSEGEVVREAAEKGLDEDLVRDFIATISMEGKPEDVLKKIKPSLKDTLALEGLGELEEFISLSKPYGIYEKLKLNLSMVRGLDYYTGTIFEFKATDAKIGSFMGGGRFDKLVSAAGGEAIAATGLSIGVDRLVEILRTKEKLKASGGCRVLVGYFPNCREKAIEIAQGLRKAGVETDFDTKRRSVSKVLDYANAKKIPYVVLVGEKELKENKVALKNMETGEQKLVKESELLKSLK
ncbi:MAG: histidine--tRNA ligase [archaeon]